MFASDIHTGRLKQGIGYNKKVLLNRQLKSEANNTFCGFVSFGQKLFGRLTRLILRDLMTKLKVEEIHDNGRIE